MLFVKNRRVLAKLIDLLAFGGFMSLGVRWFDSQWVGLLIGGAYLSLSDALGMSAKNWFSLGVMDVDSGRRCSVASSILRNSPWLAAPLFRTALTSFHDGTASSQAYDLARGVVGLVGLAVVVSLWRGLGRDGTGRHWADELAGTKVISTKQTGAVRARDPLPKKGGVRFDPTTDHDAVDFDDADDDTAAGPARSSRPARPRANPKPATPARDRDRDAVDFDDAN